MTPNNNLSVLPFYSALAEQNARRWWIHGRIYPLFQHGGSILPFQVIRDKRTIPVYEPDTPIDAEEEDEGYITRDNRWVQGVGNSVRVAQYDVDGVEYGQVYLQNCAPRYADDDDSVRGLALDENNDILDIFIPDVEEDAYFTGIWVLPEGTTHIRIMEYNAAAGSEYAEVWSTTQTGTATRPINQFSLYTKDGAFMGDFSESIASYGLSIKTIGNKDVIVFTSATGVGNLANGQYYIVMGDGIETWYSEIFTVVNDITPYIKLEWWDDADFTMDAGTIVYTNPSFKNVLYLGVDIAKPKYEFEDEAEDRDGYSFVTKQISRKTYRFSMLAPEYLCDVMRFIRMTDHITITANGKTYIPDSFLITPEWEDNGDVANVDVEFTTDTVAKKIGLYYNNAQNGNGGQNV